MSRRVFAWSVAAILAASALLRLYRIDAPVVDCFWAKQVAVANRARNMAGPPFDPWHASFDFCITLDGTRMPCVEEFPLYHGLVAVGYRVFGQQDWFGRATSGVGSLLAILCFIALMRREYDGRFALVAGVLFAACPMLLFYGRAVMPDVWMLAAMLLAAYLFRLALERGRWTGLVAAGLAGLLAVAFKYYGLMVLLPMAEMAWRRRGRQGLVWLCLPAAIMLLPLAAWLGLVFFRSTNPAEGGTYFVFQRPAVLWDVNLWTRLADRFLWKSCGPVTAVLLAVGLLAAATRRIRPGPIVSWAVMGLGFFVLLSPKSLGHEYYELMMLPAGAGLAALGWCYVQDRLQQKAFAPAWRLRAGVAVLCAAAILHSPWIARDRFRQNLGFLAAADAARRHCPPGGRIVAGPATPQPIIHYAHRDGWTWEELPAGWQSLFARYRELHGECIVLYFDWDTPAAQRESYGPLLKALPVLEHRSGLWAEGGRPCDYYVLGLRDARPVAGEPSVAKREPSGAATR